MKKVSVKEIVLVTDSGMEIGAKFKPEGVEIRHPNALELQSVAEALIIFGEFLTEREGSAKAETGASSSYAPPPTYTPYEPEE